MSLDSNVVIFIIYKILEDGNKSLILEQMFSASYSDLALTCLT
ncbi:predicted protein [Sclerotinia sclerotiorum 1980 UF-70]|uniref:Uncharacterized protein n=1 Tax=Sclerotinia sclerotiorum (strain ATCC 18683 / 1980 / Ss-1) TaxID=665079 RepID=A7ENX7_SCLS1|nr:predicted protein [Sclerotinia sclerotiorum 1980 UF-70]EDO04543.1 predicted protein [Sclerotinia sclerotiorum 1980 UF-70]